MSERLGPPRRLPEAAYPEEITRRSRADVNETDIPAHAGRRLLLGLLYSLDYCSATRRRPIFLWFRRLAVRVGLTLPIRLIYEGIGCDTIRR